jgi:hypothetical protein
VRVLAHLKSNAVAYVALMVALGGTSYAAVNLPRNSVGPKQLKRNAVNSAKVRNRSLRSVDFAAGQLRAGPAGPQGPAGRDGQQGPPGPTFGAAEVTNGGDPGTPEQIAATYPFALPSGGPTYVRSFQANLQVSCTSGQGKVGLYVDNNPVPDTSVVVPSAQPAPVELVAVVDLQAGQHNASALIDCPSGQISGSPTFGNNQTWTVLRLGQSG